MRKRASLSEIKTKTTSASLWGGVLDYSKSCMQLGCNPPSASYLDLATVLYK